MRFPSPNKEIQQLATKLCDEHGFTFNGIDSQEHLTFTTPNGHPYKLSSTPARSFSVQIELTSALKLAGLTPTRGKRNATALREREANARSQRQQADEAQQAAWAQAVAAANDKARRDRLRRQIDKRRDELISMNALMGVGRVRTF